MFESEEESTTEAKSQPPIEGSQEGRVRIGCTINTSPGTSEVHIYNLQKLDPNTRLVLLLLYIIIVQFYSLVQAIIYAALYLRLKKNSDSEGDSRGIKAARIADILEPNMKSKRDLLVRVLMMSEREVEDVVFMRPLHVNLKFNCDNHPKGVHSQAIVLTDSSVEAHVTL